MSGTNVISVKITGDESGLKAALDSGVQELNKFSNQTDEVLKKIETNTGGKLLFLQKVTVAMHGISKAFSTINGAFSSFIKDANDENFAMTDEARQSAKDLEESINSLCTVAKSAKDEFLSTMAPAITSVVQGVATFVGWIRNAIVEFPVLAYTLEFLAATIGAVAVAIGIAKIATIAWNIALNMNPIFAAITSFTATIAILTTLTAVICGATNATDANTNALKKNAAAERKAAEEKERAATAARKKEEAEKKAAEAAKKAQEAQKGIAESEKSLADSGKSSAQKEVEKIDEDIAAYQSNWRTRKGWLLSKKNRTKEEQAELDSMTGSRYNDYINSQRQRQRDIRAGLSFHNYQPENPAADAVRNATINLANVRANGGSSEAVAKAEQALKNAEMRFTQSALQASGEEKNSAHAAYVSAKAEFERADGKDVFKKEELYKAMVEAQKKSQEADDKFARLAEQNYKMHEVKMPEYTYSSAGGTFNAYAVGALGSDIPKQQLEVLQQVAGKMDDIINNQQEAGVFA